MDVDFYIITLALLVQIQAIPSMKSVDIKKDEIQQKIEKRIEKYIPFKSKKVRAIIEKTVEIKPEKNNFLGLDSIRFDMREAHEGNFGIILKWKHLNF